MSIFSNSVMIPIHTAEYKESQNKCLQVEMEEEINKTGVIKPLQFCEKQSAGKLIFAKSKS